MPTDSAAWMVQIGDAGVPGETYGPWDEAAWVLGRLEHALSRRGSAAPPSGRRTAAETSAAQPDLPPASDPAPLPDWNDVCLALEVADSVTRSMRRKRTIEITTGDRSEESVFKGYMAAAGCLILLAVLAGFLGLAIVEGFRLPLRESIPQPLRTAPAPGAAAESPQGDWPLWVRFWPVYPLVVFLLLQLLLRIARKASTTTGSAAPPSAPHP